MYYPRSFLKAYYQSRAMKPATLGPVQLADVARRVIGERKLAAIAPMISFLPAGRRQAVRRSRLRAIR